MRGDASAGARGDTGATQRLAAAEIESAVLGACHLSASRQLNRYLFTILATSLTISSKKLWKINQPQRVIEFTDRRPRHVLLLPRKKLMKNLSGKRNIRWNKSSKAYEIVLTEWLRKTGHPCCGGWLIYL
jgi:hypothetical protein